MLIGEHHKDHHTQRPKVTFQTSVGQLWALSGDQMVSCRVRDSVLSHRPSRLVTEQIGSTFWTSKLIVGPEKVKIT